MIDIILTAIDKKMSGFAAGDLLADSESVTKASTSSFVRMKEEGQEPICHLIEELFPTF